MSRLIFLAILGATMSTCSIGAAQNSLSTETSNKAKPAKIWTNENIEALRGSSQISIVGQIQKADGGPPRNRPDRSSTSAAKTYVPPEADPAWYGKQLKQIDSELENANQQIQQIHTAIQNGSTSNSVALIIDYSDLGISTDSTLQRLEKRKRELQAKAGELEEMARKNDLEPGLLRNAEEKASSSMDEIATHAGAETGEVDARTSPEPGPTVVKDESFWRGKFSDLHHRLSQAQTELNVLQREWGTLLMQYYPDPGKAMREGYTRHEINEHKEEIDAKKQEITQLLQQISDLEDDLRKAGGAPGWSRP